MWDPETYLGVMPRSGTADQIRWYRGPARSTYRYFNAFNKGTVIHIDGCLAEAQTAPFMYPRYPRRVTGPHQEPSTRAPVKP
jgi:hypothetical protein